MSDVFQRFWRILRGKVNKGLDQLEDPQEQLDVVVDELNAQVADLRKAVAGPMAHEKRLKLEIEENLSRAAEWKQRAILALEQGDEELAGQALLKKEEVEERSLALQQDWEAQRTATEKLKQTLHATKLRVDEAKRKYALLAARHQSAMAQKKIADLTVDTDQAPTELIDRLNDKILRLEAETATSLELSGEGLGSDLESKFLEIERRKRGELALAELKASLQEKKEVGPSRVAELKAELDGD